MSKVLVTFRDNWADEMDIEGFRVFDKDEWEKIKESVKKVFEPMDAVNKVEQKKADDARAKGEYYYAKLSSYTAYVGTNEEVDYYGYDEWEDRLLEKEITLGDAQFLKESFGEHFGHFIIPEEYEDY